MQGEVRAAENSFGYKKGDKITAIRFLQDQKTVRITLKQGKNYSHIDVTSGNTSTIAEAGNFGYSDLSVFKQATESPEDRAL